MDGVLTPLMIKISFKPADQTVKNVKLVKEFICQQNIFLLI